MGWAGQGRARRRQASGRAPRRQRKAGGDGPAQVLRLLGPARAEIPLYHFHPFRFLEWIHDRRRRRDEGRGQPGDHDRPRLQDRRFVPEKKRPAALHFRRVLGEREQAPATLTLTSGFKTATTKLPITDQARRADVARDREPRRLGDARFALRSEPRHRDPGDISASKKDFFVLLADDCPDVFGRAGRHRAVQHRDPL